MNALTESAALELAEFGISARIVLPGMAHGTSFSSTAQARIAAGGFFPARYEEFANRTLAAMQEAGSGQVATAEDVAQAVFRAATDPNCPRVVPAGADAVAWASEN